MSWLLLLLFADVTLTWDPPAANTPTPQGYYVYQDGVRVATVPGRTWTGAVTFADAPICWKATAYNAIGESGFSNEVCMGKPQAPTALNAALAG